jgi:hypothetical protein
MTFQIAKSVINALPYEEPPGATTFTSTPAEFPS